MTFYIAIFVMMLFLALLRYGHDEINGWELAGEILIALIPGVNFIYFIYIMIAT